MNFCLGNVVTVPLGCHYRKKGLVRSWVGSLFSAELQFSFMASSSSSSGATISSAFSHGPPSSYDVFINFRDVDTGTNFVNLLYKALISHGIRTFIDSKELWEGEEICPSLLRAIRGSKISIPVFSEHYADSKYCLLELAEIWKCRYDDQTVLPIFIDVEPFHVRYQTKSFQGSFEKHLKRNEAAIVESWKDALTNVANLKGWAFKGDATIEEKSNVIELVVQRALREQGSTPLYERKHLVGIDSHLDEVCLLLNIGSDDVRFVGICGMGGLGKTTIAEAVYNHIFKSFNRRSFLKDVREAASQDNNGLVSLQKRFLKDMKMDCDINSVSEGKQLIAERLHRENILLILDDVDNHVQLDAFVGGLNWFGQGSKVIITTRNVHILNVHKEKVGKYIHIYMPEELNFENSLQLFSLHAFSKNGPPEKYKQLAHEVVHYAGGLPLSLEVLGKILSEDRRYKEEWEDTVKRLKDIVVDKVYGNSIKDYDDKVFKKLMISYNQLGGPEKTIFLDVACHFNGWYKEEAISIWEACKLHPRSAIKELIQKHLLKIDGDENLRMHDQLRYMGMGIILDDSCGVPTRRRRLWSQDEIKKALKDDTGTQMVEGILFDRKFKFEAKDVLRCEDFQKMPNLRFLQLDGIASLNGDFVHLPSNLRWFRWRLTSKILPRNFFHPELVHLEFSGNNFKRLWNGPPQNENKRFQNLKVLDLSGCQRLSVSPDFLSWFPCLQTLNLSECNSLSELPNSICRMASLKALILSACTSLKKLPKSIGDLKDLVKLYVNSTNIKDLPNGVGHLEKLEELDASNISCYHGILNLPTSMGRMRRLRHFNLEATMIARLPNDISKLSSLEVFRMGMPFSVCSNLGQSGYIRGESLPELPSMLTHLKVVSCISLPNLSHMRRLEELSLPNYESLVELPDLSYLRWLRKLDISYCGNLEEIRCLQGTESLEELQASNCRKLTELSGLSNLKRLRLLNIAFCDNLEKIHGLEVTDYLEELIATGCNKLTELPDLSRLKRLRKLNVSLCENLEKICSLEGTEYLEELHGRSCPKLTELSDLSKLKRLRKLEIAQCENLEEIHGLEGTESLESLDASGSYKMTETTKKIHGKGNLLDNFGEVHSSSSVADDKINNLSSILCIVFAWRCGSRVGFEPEKLQAGELVTVYLYIEAFIRRRRGMRTKCSHSIRIEDIEFTSRDIIYIHHFKGFDWFGFPLESKYAIEELEFLETRIYSHSGNLIFGCSLEVKFWKVLFVNKESDQQMTNQQSSAMLVADFFRWSDGDDDEEVEGSNNVPEEVEEEDQTAACLQFLCRPVIAVWDFFYNCSTPGVLS